MRLALGLFVLIVAGGMAWIRLAPSDPARWNVPLRPDQAAAGDTPGEVRQSGPGGATVRLVPAPGETPSVLLARLDHLALATPRTTRLQGSAGAGRITWISRSRVFGFPDYITAETGPDAVTVYSRLRYGRRDFGVNAARLRAWTAALTRP
ncbi:MAG: DUF1499 domain-containing protein [Rhodobacteraceae bacterium]|nr:DUF1499 domain-containing protein [Paracoccaceae bacterium]